MKQDVSEPKGFSSPLSAGHRDPSWNASSFLGKALHLHPASPLAPTQQELTLKKGLTAEETKASLCHVPLPSPGKVGSRCPPAALPWVVASVGPCLLVSKGRAEMGLGQILPFLPKCKPTHRSHCLIPQRRGPDGPGGGRATRSDTEPPWASPVEGDVFTLRTGAGVGGSQERVY